MLAHVALLVALVVVSIASARRFREWFAAMFLGRPAPWWEPPQADPHELVATEDPWFAEWADLMDAPPIDAPWEAGDRPAENPTVFVETEKTAVGDQKLLIPELRSRCTAPGCRSPQAPVSCYCFIHMSSFTPRFRRRINEASIDELQALMHDEVAAWSAASPTN